MTCPIQSDFVIDFMWNWGEGTADTAVALVVAVVLWKFVRWWRTPSNTEPQPKIQILDSVVLLQDSRTACMVAQVLTNQASVLETALSAQVAYPPSLGRMYCPYCWAALLLRFPDDMMLAYVRHVESRFPQGLTGDVEKHVDCIFLGGNDCSSYVYHVRKFTMGLKARLWADEAERSAVSALLATLDNRHQAEGEQQLRLESGRGGSQGDRKYKGTKDPVMRARYCADFAVHVVDEEWERMELQKAIEDAQLEYDQVNAYGDEEGSWADAMDAADVAAKLYMLSNTYKDKYGDHYEGIREEWSKLRAAHKVDHFVVQALVQHEEVETKCVKEHAEALRKSGCAIARIQLEENYKTGARELCAEHETMLKSMDPEKYVLLAQHYSALSGAPVPKLEAGQRVIIADDESFQAVYGEEELKNAIVSGMEKSLKLVDQHRKIAREMQKHTKGDKARAPRKFPDLESEISGSRKYKYDTPSALVVHDSGPRGALVIPTASGLCVVTHRHHFDDDTGMFVDKPYAVGDKITLYLGVDRNKVNTSRDGVVESIMCPEGKDQMWLYTNASAEGVSRVSIGVPGVGKPVKQVTASAKLVDGRWDVTWSESMGKLVHVTTTHVCYDFTTTRGDCGFPVVQNDGTVVGTHQYGGIEYLSGRLANAAERVSLTQAPKRGRCEIPPYEPIPHGPSLQGRVIGRVPIPMYSSEEKFRRTEPVKYYALRNDKNLAGLLPKHHWMKPSTKMCHVEVAKFFDTVAFKLDKDLFNKAIVAATLYDMYDSSASPFVPVTYDGALAVLNRLDLSKSAGPIAEGLNTMNYLEVLGEGNIGLGKSRCAERVVRLYNAALNVNLTDDDDITLLTEMSVWNVIAKCDGYAEKKLPCHDPPGSGRTVQAPSLEMKVLWLCCFGDNDYYWVHREDSWVHAGEDDDLPVGYAELMALLKALGATAADLSGYDRFTQSFMTRAFFLVYLKHICPGAPILLLSWLSRVVTHGPLLTSDGCFYMRDHGTPSGFMNTLRLNCVIHLFCIAYALMVRTGIHDSAEMAQFMREECHLKVCGDDSAHLALTQRAYDAFDIANGSEAYLKVWADQLPWEVKLEGAVTFDPADSLDTRAHKMPSMVSRRYVVMHGVLYAPLHNFSRCLKRLSCCEKRDAEDELALVHSAMASLALPLYWHSKGWMWSPVLDHFWREYGHVGDPMIIVRRVAKLHRSILRQSPPAAPIAWEKSRVWKG